jgi:hypothetical protein
MELIDALCVLKMGWSTEDERKVFNQAREVVGDRVDYLRTKIQHEELAEKLAKWEKPNSNTRVVKCEEVFGPINK